MKAATTHSTFRHNDHGRRVLLNRFIDKKVFGTYRAVTERSFKAYRIGNGTVQIKFCGKWEEVVEIHASSTDNHRDIIAELSAEKGKACYGTGASVEIVWSRS